MVGGSHSGSADKLMNSYVFGMYSPGVPKEWQGRVRNVSGAEYDSNKIQPEKATWKESYNLPITKEVVRGIMPPLFLYPTFNFL